MAHLRIRPNGRIQFDLHLYGQRFREGTKLMATPKNLKQAQATLKQMNAEIDLGTFCYRDYFPASKKLAQFEALQRDKHPTRLCPYFDTFAAQWCERQKAKWRPSYQTVVNNTLTCHLLPVFGNTLVSEITLSQVEYFRNHLVEQRGDNGKRRYSNRRINNILWPLVSVLSLAADEFGFPYPLRRYRTLREEKADSHPMTIEEVQRFLTAVDPAWRDYFMVRFWTGMRSCEVHGLYWEHIDFDHRLIRVRQNLVNGIIGDVKTPKSRRSLKMCDALYDALKRQHARRLPDCPFVFASDRRQGLDNHFVSEKLWHPTLKKAGLSPRRTYETRHTAAVLHIAAHENPLYISQMLGHSDTKLLFEVYAPYVANATGVDGAAFHAMMQARDIVPVSNSV